MVIIEDEVLIALEAEAELLRAGAEPMTRAHAIEEAERCIISAFLTWQFRRQSERSTLFLARRSARRSRCLIHVRLQLQPSRRITMALACCPAGAQAL